MDGSRPAINPLPSRGAKQIVKVWRSAIFSAIVLNPKNSMPHLARRTIDAPFVHVPCNHFTHSKKEAYAPERTLIR